MNETKNQCLAREITDYCKERLKSPASKARRAKSIYPALLTTFLAITLMNASTEPNHGGWWMA